MNLNPYQLKIITSILSIQAVGNNYRTADWENILRMASYAGLDVTLELERLVNNHRRLSGNTGYSFSVPPIEEYRQMLKLLDKSLSNKEVPTFSWEFEHELSELKSTLNP